MNLVSHPLAKFWKCYAALPAGHSTATLDRLFASLVSVFGIGVFALPTAIVIAAIIESSAVGSPYVCDACGHHGTTSHADHKRHGVGADPT